MNLLSRHSCVVVILLFLPLAAVLGAPSTDSNSSARKRAQEKVKQFDSEYRHYDPAVVTIYKKQQVAAATTASPVGKDELLVDIQASKKLFRLDLKLNRLFIHPDYKERSITQSGKIEYHANANTTLNCYYTGHVANDKNSIAAADTCNGLSARIVSGGEIYHVEPIDGTIDGEHRVYKQSDTLLPPTNCGNDDKLSAIFESKEFRVNRKKRDIQWPQDLDGKARLVELYVANDYRQYVAQGSSVSAVSTRTKQIVNFVSSMYQSQDIYVSLVGMEVWTTGSLIAINTSNVITTLSNFAAYRKTYINPFHYNDIAHLISTIIYPGGVVGLSYQPGMCSPTLSASLINDVCAAAGVAATTMAHEMGHTFGLRHDTEYTTNCSCSDSSGYCIMYPATFAANPATTWSQCSINSLNTFLSSGYSTCMNDFNGAVFDPAPVCGNGIVETGEQCDCGKAPATECNPACCSATTCQLLSSFTCASGRCCNVATCQLKPITSVCRNSSGPCDLAEYCSGVNNTCPSDAYAHDGTDCTVGGVAAYCYAGHCKSHTTQCQLWWGATVSSGVSDCYQYVNVLGRVDGNCGYNTTTGVYKACSTSDIKCGTLHCNINVTNLSSQLLLPYLGQLYVYGTYLTYSSGSKVMCTAGTNKEGLSLYSDPGFVPNGASCGTGLMCLNQHCVTAASVLSQTPCPNCNQHGVCNNLGQCHCDIGYAPPDCSLPGNGGSYHSNPISQASTSVVTSIATTEFAITTNVPTTTA